MRRVAAGLLVALLTGCAGSYEVDGPTSVADCVAPSTLVLPVRAQPGEALVVTGEGLGTCGSGEALPDADVVLRQGGRTELLGRARERDGVLRLETAVPRWAVLGSAEVEVAGTAPFLLAVGDGRGGFAPPPPPPGPQPLVVDLVDVPDWPEGGHVVVHAEVQDADVPADERQLVRVVPIGTAQVDLGALRPSYWTVTVYPVRCDVAGCPPPQVQVQLPAMAGAPATGAPPDACAREVRLLDAPVHVRYLGGRSCDVS